MPSSPSRCSPMDCGAEMVLEAVHRSPTTSWSRLHPFRNPGRASHGPGRLGRERAAPLCDELQLAFARRSIRVTHDRDGTLLRLDGWQRAVLRSAASGRGRCDDSRRAHGRRRRNLLLGTCTHTTRTSPRRWFASRSAWKDRIAGTEPPPDAPGGSHLHGELRVTGAALRRVTLQHAEPCQRDRTSDHDRPLLQLPGQRRKPLAPTRQTSPEAPDVLARARLSGPSLPCRAGRCGSKCRG